MPGSNSLISRSRREDRAALQVAIFQSETQAVFHRLTPGRALNILYILSGMIVLSLLLMGVVKLDRVVTGQGEIVPVEGSIFVQPLDRAIVKEIKVRTGDVVRKGQVLARLDPTFARATLDQYEQRDVATHALVARLEAESSGKAYVPDSSDSDSELQLTMFRQRQTEYRQSLNDFDSRIAAAQAAMARASSNAQTYGRQLVIADQIKGMRSQLEQKGYGSKLNTMIATAESASVERQMSESHHEASQMSAELQALRAQRAVYISKWHDDVAVQLVSARRELSDTRGEVTKARKISDLIELLAPENAVVLDIGQASVGSVVETSQGAKPLFTLTPLRGKLEAEIAIRGQDIGFLKKGDPVTIKLDAYDYLRHSTAHGKIVSISEGSFTRDTNGNPREPYFKARVRIDNVRLVNVPGDFRLIPGMTLTGDVLIGKRTILSYLLSGAQHASSEAMREPQ